MKIHIINGPNLNMLGVREPSIYGYSNLNDMELLVRNMYPDIDFEFMQSNSESEIVTYLQQIYQCTDGIIINPAAFSHYSIAILDALLLHDVCKVEVHLSDIKSREDFRKVLITNQGCDHMISGLGIQGYILGVKHIINN